MKGESGVNAANLSDRLQKAGGASLKSYSPIQLFFLMRLSYLQRERRSRMATQDSSDWQMRLIHKSLYSTYQDCIDQGVGDEAKLLMTQQTAERTSQ